ncbi:DNA repair protein XRCC2 [Gracilaria domingensis]|nr:DNA repair protein XRCC2 [Gracilaria domingensis]
MKSALSSIEVRLDRIVGAGTMNNDGVSKAIARRLGSYPVSGKTEKSLAPIISTGVGILDEVEQNPVRLGSLVDVSGVTTGGKTQLLHVITAHILLNHSNEEGAIVCWFDLNRGLDPNRLRHLMRLKRRKSSALDSDDDQNDDLKGLKIYYPSSTIAMCSSLHALEEFISTEDGKGVKAVVIDSLGSFHYVDKYIFDNSVTGTSVRTQSHELVLSKVLANLLSLQKVAVFASKSCLFDETKLDVAWPFPQAGVPMIPKEFMPDSWKSLITHMVLMYHIETQSDGRNSSRRGLIAMRHPESRSAGRRAVVSAAAVASIDNDGVVIESMHII